MTLACQKFSVARRTVFVTAADDVAVATTAVRAGECSIHGRTVCGIDASLAPIRKTCPGLLGCLWMIESREDRPLDPDLDRR